MGTSPDIKTIYRDSLDRRRKKPTNQPKPPSELTRKTTFPEFIRHCHDQYSKPLQAAPSPCPEEPVPRPIPTEKVCPRRLEPWAECAAEQEQLYRRVCAFFSRERVFDTLGDIQRWGEDVRSGEGQIRDERALAYYQRAWVENQVGCIVKQLWESPLAREVFRLERDGISFAWDLGSAFILQSHKEDDDALEGGIDAFSVYRGEGQERLLLTGEYKAPDRLTMEELRVGLRPGEFYEEVVLGGDVPGEEDRAENEAVRLVGAALAQEYHTMIGAGLEYGLITTGFGLVLLRVRYENPETLYYYLCEPNAEADGDTEWSRQPVTAMARVLCLCLMSLTSQAQDPRRCTELIDTLPKWVTSFEQVYWDQNQQSQPPKARAPSADLFRFPSPSRRHSKRVKRTSPIHTRQRTRRAEGTYPSPHCTPGGPKRRLDESPSSSSAPLSKNPRTNSISSRSCSAAQFCTQKCLLGLKNRSKLDENCPNVALHRENGSTHHRTTAQGVVNLLRQDIDESFDGVQPLGVCGASGAPFKLTSTRYGYTVIGKGTTCYLWPQLEREADVYRMLSGVQGSAVPVFLGRFNMQKTFHLHGAGKIRHMLVMGWGGEMIDRVDMDWKTEREVTARSEKEIRCQGVLHRDLASRNILWNEELDRAMIIDFHLCEFELRRVKESLRPRWLVEEKEKLESGIPVREDGRRHCAYHGTCLHFLDEDCSEKYNY